MKKKNHFKNDFEKLGKQPEHLEMSAFWGFPRQTMITQTFDS